MIERVEHLAEGVSLYLGDCRTILPTLGKVGAVITDPPYGIGYAKYESHEDCPEDYPLLIGLSVDEAERHLEDGWMCVFQAAKTAPQWHKWFRRPYRPIALPKTFVQILPTLGPTWATDYAIVWPVGKPSQRGKLRDWFVCETSDMSLRPKGHPCPRPLAGMKFLVEALSERDQVVLDPFCGSGTTGVAAVKLGRRFIGIEIEPAYFDIARARIVEALRQPDLFIEKPAREEPAELQFGEVT